MKAVAEADIIKIAIEAEVADAEEIIMIISLDDRGEKGRIVPGRVCQVPQWRT